MKHIQKVPSEDVHEEMFILYAHMWEIPMNENNVRRFLYLLA